MKLDSVPLSIADFTPKLTATLDKSKSVDPQIATNKSSSTGAVFSSTFITIFLAELGDKTQLSTLLMSAESQAPGVVFF